MPAIEVWCLPDGLAEEELKGLFEEIVSAVTSVKEFGLKNERDMTILFPPDRMRYGLGEDIIVRIWGLFEKPERTREVRNRLAQRVGEVVKKRFPSACVECFVETFNPQEGFWSSEMPEEERSDDRP